MAGISKGRQPGSRPPEMHEARSVSRPGLEISKRDSELLTSPFYLIAAPTTTVSAAAGSRSGFRSRAGFVNGNRAAVKLGPVKGFDCGARLVRVSDLNKTKTAGSTRVTVLDDGRPGDLSESCKGLIQPCVSGVIREVTYVYVHTLQTHSLRRLQAACQAVTPLLGDRTTNIQLSRLMRADAVKNGRGMVCLRVRPVSAGPPGGTPRIRMKHPLHDAVRQNSLAPHRGSQVK